MKRITFLVCFFVVLCANSAQLKLAGIFTDNAVLQQNTEIPVWGWAVPNTEVKVSIAGRTHSVLTNDKGRWQLRLQPFAADNKTHTLVVQSGNDSIQLRNILFGEVWFASGQSNMEWKLRSGVVNGEQEIASASYPNIRIHTIKALTSAQPLNDISCSEWKVCAPKNAPDFSAIAYFFARQLHLDKNVPVGVIVAARGATNIETWMSPERLMTHPDYTEAVQNFDTDTARWNAKVRASIQSELDREKIVNTSLAGINIKVHTLKYDDAAWTKTEYPLNMTKMGYPGFWGLIWVRKTFEIPSGKANQEWRLTLPIKDQNDRIYLNGKEIAQGISKLKNKEITLPKGLLKASKNLLAIRMYVHWGSAEIGNDVSKCFLKSDDNERIELTGTWTHSNKIEPSVAQWQNYYNTNNVNYNAMVAPVMPYGIRGFLWYQGENNASRFKQYVDLQPMLIDDWRVRWGQGYLPFQFVQLANFKERSADPVDKDDWAAFRDAQTSTLQRSQNTAMACAIDIGDGNDIHPKNKQEVGKRLYIGAKAKAYKENIIYSGPMFKSAKLEGDILKITFDYAQNGLKTPENKLVKGFAVSDKNGKWSWVEAKIIGNEIHIETGHAPSSKIITRVQYAWQSNPECNLYNIEGLPAVPFNVEIRPKPMKGF